MFKFKDELMSIKIPGSQKKDPFTKVEFNTSLIEKASYSYVHNLWKFMKTDTKIYDKLVHFR
jgi:hypothetical protein